VDWIYLAQKCLMVGYYVSLQTLEWVNCWLDDKKVYKVLNCCSVTCKQSHVDVNIFVHYKIFMYFTMVMLFLWQH
jgi:hypothetical protein